MYQVYKETLLQLKVVVSGHNDMSIYIQRILAPTAFIGMDLSCDSISLVGFTIKLGFEIQKQMHLSWIDIYFVKMILKLTLLFSFIGCFRIFFLFYLIFF